jgi:zinc transport system substrate-binding protein
VLTAGLAACLPSFRLSTMIASFHTRSLPRRASMAALATVCVWSCVEPGLAKSENGPPRVVASIFPLGDLTAMVAGTDLTVEVLVPPRADPSTFEPSPRRLRELAGARAFIIVGGGVDDWSQAALPGTDNIPRVALNDGITLRKGGGPEGTHDPHVWLDPVMVRDSWLPLIVATLVAARPDAREALEARGQIVADSLTTLDAWMSAHLTPASGRAFVATHSAWHYLAARHGIRELGAVYSSPGQEPSARSLANLVQQARAAGVRAVFTEPQLGDTGARALAGELGVPVYVLDPLGGPGLVGRETYLEMMRFNTMQMARALDGEL